MNIFMNAINSHVIIRMIFELEKINLINSKVREEIEF